MATPGNQNNNVNKFSFYLYFVFYEIFNFEIFVLLSGALGAFEEFVEICGEDDTALNIVDNQDRSPLHWACIGGHGELVDILLNRGGLFKIIYFIFFFQISCLYKCFENHNLQIETSL